ncbi:hypothetical protein PMAYCL1PPCAC_04678, partial [Pristionchus mayeri]
FECIGDRCAQYGFTGGTMRQFCLVNVHVYNGLEGCYLDNMYESIHCVCSSDMCNSDSFLLNSTIQKPPERKCFIGV